MGFDKLIGRNITAYILIPLCDKQTSIFVGILSFVAFQTKAWERDFFPTFHSHAPWNPAT
jgi:hypothetical protein